MSRRPISTPRQKFDYIKLRLVRFERCVTHAAVRDQLRVLAKEMISDNLYRPTTSLSDIMISVRSMILKLSDSSRAYHNLLRSCTIL